MRAVRGFPLHDPLAADLDHVLGCTRQLWEDLRGERVFITGGTGFVGKWLLESLLWAADRLDLGVRVTVLTRDPGKFGRDAPHLANHSAVRLHQGDVRSFEFPDGAFSQVVHAAAQFSSVRGRVAPGTTLDSIDLGTRRVLELARRCGAGRLLFVSSGAVYGPQAPSTARISEEQLTAPDPTDLASAYAEGKRVAESLCRIAQQDSGVETKIARCFAFVGPYLPLDAGYAVGNFLADAMKGGPVHVTGDGTPRRSYLYAADLAIWLWTILCKGAPGRAYNVGSEDDVSIADLARRVATLAGTDIGVRIDRLPVEGAAAGRYVPCTRRAREELGLACTVQLDDAIARTIKFLRPELSGASVRPSCRAAPTCATESKERSKGQPE